MRILGEDYIGDNGKPIPFTGDELPPEIVYTTRSHGWSTTKLKDLIDNETEQNLGWMASQPLAKIANRFFSLMPSH